MQSFETNSGMARCRSSWSYAQRATKLVGARAAVRCFD